MDECSKILVTGGAGFIGSHLAHKLMELGRSVTVLDNLSHGVFENIESLVNSRHVEFVKGDIRDGETVRSAMREVDAVVHLAALIDVAESVNNPLEAHNVNVNGTQTLLEQSAKLNISRFLLTSTTAVYGDGNPLPLREDASLKPISPYASSKAAAERCCTAFQTNYGLNTTILRLFNVYGPKSGDSSYANVITTFLNNAQKGKPLTIFGDGEQTRDFIRVEDVVDAIVKALDSGNAVNKILNVCTGSPTSINRLAQIVKEMVRSDVAIEYNRPRAGDVYHNYGDPTKAEDTIGFRARISIEEGLKQLMRETR